MSIPKTIWRFWGGGAGVPNQILNWWVDWEELHPDWTVYSMTPESARLWLVDEFVDLWDRMEDITLRPWSVRSNLFRYSVLLKEGGVWVDADFEPLKPIDPLLNVSAFAAWCEPRAWFKGNTPHESETGLYCANGLMGSEPGHRWLRDIVDLTPYNIRQNLHRTRGANSRWLCGPRFVTSLLDHDVTVYERELFYPYIYGQDDPGEYPNSYAVHRWGMTPETGKVVGK